MTSELKIASDDDVIALCDELWQFRLRESPEMATFCGFHDYDDRWDDLTEEGCAKRAEKVVEFLDRAKQLDVSQCSYCIGLSNVMLIDDLQVYLDGSKFKTEFMQFNAMEGIHIDASLTFSYMKYETIADFDKYIKRLERLPQRIRDSQNMLERGVERGITMFHTTLSQMPSQLDGLIGEDTDKLGFLIPFREKHKSLREDVITQYQDRARAIVKERIIPAYAELKRYVEEVYIHHTRPLEGVSTLPNGEAWYQQCLIFHLNSHQTPKEVHAIGLREVERVKSQIMAIAKREGLGDTMQEVLTTVHRQQENYFKSEEEVMDFVKHLCRQRIRPKLAKAFKNLPKIDMQISPFPEYRTVGPMGYYNAGLPDGSRDGTYFVNCHELDKCYPYLLPALSLHEGEPGHHIQMGHALSATHLPAFRRYSEGLKYYLPPAKFPIHTAYAEGWSLYCEALGEELGIYENNLELLGRYSCEIFRAARIVVDTGINALGWNTEQGVEYMLENCLLEESAIRHEVERYIYMPGQGCAYKMGEIRIWEMRRKAERELGDRFDLREFHEWILTPGRLPLNVLDKVIDDFIAEAKKKQ